MGPPLRPLPPTGPVVSGVLPRYPQVTPDKEVYTERQRGPRTGHRYGGQVGVGGGGNTSYTGPLLVPY